MKRLGVISGPGKRSLSPAIQQAALDRLGLDIRYDAWPTPVEGLAARVDSLRGPETQGANVTTPHKEAVLKMVDEVDDVVRRVGAVNTIHNQGGRLLAYNTDVGGFLRALRDIARFDPGGSGAVVAGAGGAARATVVALIESGARTVRVINRTESRAARLVADLLPLAGNTQLAVWPATAESWREAAGDADLLINCTSAGSAGGPDGNSEEDDSPVPGDVISPRHLVYDLVYRPAVTRLIAEAKQRGARVIGGLPMLIFQGAASFEIWTGRPAPLDVMSAAAERALATERGG